MPVYRSAAPEASLCNATALRKASRRVTQFYDEALAPCGLRSTQYAILSDLEKRGEPPTLNELADALVLDRSSLGHTLRPLQRDRLIAIKQSTADRRRQLLTLTSKGCEKVAEARRYWRTAQEHFEATFGKRQAAQLRALLLGIARSDRFGSAT
jgi:DNA-binding MarR family transcriptional regulator